MGNYLKFLYAHIYVCMLVYIAYIHVFINQLHPFLFYKEFGAKMYIFLIKFIA